MSLIQNYVLSIQFSLLFYVTLGYEAQLNENAEPCTFAYFRSIQVLVKFKSDYENEVEPVLRTAYPSLLSLRLVLGFEIKVKSWDLNLLVLFLLNSCQKSLLRSHETPRQVKNLS